MFHPRINILLNSLPVGPPVANIRIDINADLTGHRLCTWYIINRCVIQPSDYIPLKKLFFIFSVTHWFFYVRHPLPLRTCVEPQAGVAVR